MTENKNKNFDLSQMKNDLSDIDKLFEKLPAPKLSQRDIDEIKQKINRRQTRLFISNVLIKTAAVAAVVLVAWALLTGINKEKTADNIQDSLQVALSQADTNLSALENEMQLLKSELFAIHFNEDDAANGRLTDQVGNVEAQIIETDTSFWKG